MIQRKAYRFRLYLTPQQQALLARQFGCVRWVYNHFLARRKETYARQGLWAVSERDARSRCKARR